MSSEEPLYYWSARRLAAAIRSRELSAREVVDAHLDRIAAVNPAVNAIVTLTADSARKAAARADEAMARGERVGPLHGLPIVYKDLVETRGVRTTRGSPIFADHVPDFDAASVEKLQQAGAIMVGKSNTPEFGAGSQTFNPVFGVTRNPYDLSRTCGGSSGGAAVALATGMVPIADGSDTGGSLRNPASFCNVVGLRPTPGRVSSWPASSPWSPLSVKGPMARSASDAAFLLSAMAGPDARSPLSLQDDPMTFARALDRDFSGARVAWSPALGGLPVDPAVRSVMRSARRVVESLGCRVVDADPDLSGADEVFSTFRALGFETGFGPLYDQRGSEMKETVRWNIEECRKLSARDIARAERLRAALFQRTRQFFERFDFLLCPVSQVPPFSVETEYPSEVDGMRMGSYIEWMRSASLISATAHPAASVPAGFTADGRPVGLQVVGRYGGDFGVLQFAHAFEQAAPYGQQHPALAGAA